MPCSRRSVRLGISVLPFLLATPNPASPQSDGDPVSLGSYRVLHSEILGEDRVLQVHLPRGYDSSDLEFPVVYLFYSDWETGYFAQVVNDPQETTTAVGVDHLVERVAFGRVAHALEPGPVFGLLAHG